MDAEKGWLEQRSFERVSNVLKIIYYPLDENKKAADLLATDEYKDTSPEKLLTEKTSSSYIQSMTDDISKGGLSIISDKPLEIGRLIVIDLFLPKLSKPLKILCEVRNLESGVKGGSGSYKAGLKFLSMHKADLKRIENYIAQSQFNK